jgi:uncharacterized protein
MKDIVKLAQEYVLEECKKSNHVAPMEAYRYHFKSVVMYAEKLAEERGADIEIVLLAAWLHDIASIQGEDEDHHILGAKVAEEFLKKQKYSQDRIDAVKHCIYAHRGSRDIQRETVEAECVCDADAMSHFNTVPALMYWVIKGKGFDIEEAKEFVKNKLKRSYKKLTKTGKEMIQNKYDAAMEIL